MMDRRGFLTGITGFVACAPAIVRASSLMAIKPLRPFDEAALLDLLRIIDPPLTEVYFPRADWELWRVAFVEKTGFV